MSREPEYILINPIEMAKYDVGIAERTILLVLIKNCRNSRKFGGCITEMTFSIKQEIMEYTGLKSKQSYYNALYRLVKSGLVDRVEKGVYRLNPTVFVRKGGSK